MWHRDSIGKIKSCNVRVWTVWNLNEVCEYPQPAPVSGVPFLFAFTVDGGFTVEFRVCNVSPETLA